MQRPKQRRQLFIVGADVAVVVAAFAAADAVNEQDNEFPTRLAQQQQQQQQQQHIMKCFVSSSE